MTKQVEKKSSLSSMASHDSAYGSPTDDWRFVVHAFDDLDAFKPHVKNMFWYDQDEMETVSPQELVPDTVFTRERTVSDSFVQFVAPETEFTHKRTSSYSKSKVFRCDMCTSTFSRNHDLKRHIRIHLGIRPYKCETCTKSFSRMDALHRHVHIRGCTGLE
ncbi:hypothetical protein EDD86DRAFT_208014 [Gorgonomyces haynaldii]|nr:hypothetical protein EDD86DRAFT_208014 [Gorgonomyces haynaldii]